MIHCWKRNMPNAKYARCACGVTTLQHNASTKDALIACKNCLKIMERERQNKIAIEDAQRLSEIVMMDASELWPMNS